MASATGLLSSRLFQAKKKHSQSKKKKKKKKKIKLRKSQYLKDNDTVFVPGGSNQIVGKRGTFVSCEGITG